MVSQRILAVALVVAACLSSGCSIFNSLLEGMRGYNSNDVTMSDWGNP